MKLDILIKNGHVMDPARQIDAVMDIGVIENKIVDLSKNTMGTVESVRTIDASGCYVFPGLIDFHAHVFRSGSGVSVCPEYLIPTGVTSVVDAGTAGYANYEAFYNGEITHSQVRIKSQLNVWSCGQGDYGVLEHFAVNTIKEKKIRHIVDKYRENIIGLKIRMSENVAWEPEALDKTLMLAEELRIGVCVHVSQPMMPLTDIADKLRKDDIYCHVYQHAGKDSIFDDNGKIRQPFIEAKKRGVIFDAANGKMNFNINVCRQAVEQGFYPDVISSDWLEDKYNYSPYTKNLMFIVEKYLTLGMPLMDALCCVTQTPARLMGMSGKIGTLSPGAYADIAVFKVVEKEATHLDFDGTPFVTKQIFVPQMVVSDGEIAFCQADFALV